MVRALVVCLLVAATSANAERLPVRVFTTEDGLANNRVNRGTTDANGFLWFATGEGVSRFDGARFESFGTADGLPAATSHDVLGTPDGHLFVATDGGLAVLDLARASVRPRFIALTNDATDCVIRDASGVIWAGTQKGLVRYENGRIERIAIPRGVISIAYDARDRSLWLGTFSGLVHRSSAGALEHWRVGPRDEEDDRVFRVLLARDGTLWIGHVGARVLAVTLPLASTTQPLWEVDTIRHLTPAGAARRDLFEDSSGMIWIGTSGQLGRWNGHALEVISDASLGGAGAPTPSAEDSEGNMWFGTDAQGVVRLARNGFMFYDTSDGLDSRNAYGFAEPPDGPVHVITLNIGHSLARFDGGRFTSVLPHAPPGLLGWGQSQTVAIDREHRWWYPTGYGALRFPAVEHLEQLATTQPRVYADLPGRDVLRLFADSRGDVWISTMSRTGLARWDHVTDRTVTLRDGWPGDVATAFAEDLHGDVWIGYADGHVVRARDDVPHELPVEITGNIGAVLIDAAGRLWIASDETGVTRIDDVEHPSPRSYRASAIGSDQALALVEDHGRIYVGTTRGIARIDPRTDEIVHYGAEDGLRNDYIVAAFHSRDGSLWFGSKGGAARLVPREDLVNPSVPVYITHLSLAGKPVATAVGGQRWIDSIELASGEGALDIDLASPQLGGTRPRFQFRLDDKWSAPVAEHTLHFAQLAAGHYDLEVRALDARGVPSRTATIVFEVLPPLWRRWWFVALAATMLMALGYLAYRRRLAHVLAIERVRTRIATDLHDELGSSLSRISILSEVASRRAAAHEDVGGQIEVIGSSARELVDVAADIVWATDPRRDDLGSLLIRLRTFAADLCDARGIDWSISAPNDPSSIKLGPDRRRHLYLVLKEAITNAARHSRASRVDVVVKLTTTGLVASVRDDGTGFDEPSLLRRGNGLTNMRARAADADGTLDIRCDGGTEVILRL